MSEPRPRTWSHPVVRRGLGAASTLLVVVALTACDAGSALPGGLSGDSGESSASSDASGADGSSSSGSGSSAAPAVERAEVTTNVGKGATDVAVDAPIEVTADNGTLTAVDVTSAQGALAGELAADGSAWTSTGTLEPGTSYQVSATAEQSDGSSVVRNSGFSTEDLSLDQQTYASVAPLDGETVGVGMPVIVTFDVPVTDRASIEKHLTVTSTPEQTGTWHWMSDTEVHYRPKTYWQAGTDVKVDIDVNSVPAGNGIYGQESRTVDFHVGSANVYQVNAQTHEMTVTSGGKVLRTIPITTGKEGFTTRSGTKVIIEKFDSKRMNSETVGIGGAEAYDLDNVQWAMRLTYSGEFIHAAPWSVSSQGNANVSHGCTGMSTDNAAWLYAMSKRGDVVEYTGTDRPMTLDNGYGDWNESYKDYRSGSAIS